MALHQQCLTFVLILACPHINADDSSTKIITDTASPTSASVAPTPYGTPLQSSASIPWSWYGSPQRKPTASPSGAPSFSPTETMPTTTAWWEQPVVEERSPVPTLSPKAPTTPQVNMPDFINSFSVPSPAPTKFEPMMKTGKTIELGIEIWSAAYAAQILLLCVFWRCWVRCRDKATPKFDRPDPENKNYAHFQRIGEDELTYEALRHEFARSRDNIQYIAGFGFMTCFFFWLWALYNVAVLHIVDLGVGTCFLAMVSHLIGLGSVGRRLIEVLPASNVRNAYLYKNTVLWTHLLVVLSFCFEAYISTTLPDNNYFSHCLIMAMLWLFAGILVRRSAGKWCETIEVDSMIETRTGKRKIVNGVLSAPKRSERGKKVTKKDKEKQSNFKAFSGKGNTTTPIPPTKVAKRSDFTELSPEGAVASDSIFQHVQRNAFDDEDAAAGLEMGFKHMRDDLAEGYSDSEESEDLDASPFMKPDNRKPR